MKNYDAEKAEKNIRELLEMEDLDKKTAAGSGDKPKKKKKKKKNKN